MVMHFTSEPNTIFLTLQQQPIISIMIVFFGATGDVTHCDDYTNAVKLPHFVLNSPFRPSNVNGLTGMYRYIGENDSHFIDPPLTSDSCNAHQLCKSS